MTRSFKNKKKAFTLVELLVVIAIIGILFIVLVSKVDFATDKAKAIGVQTVFRSYQMSLSTVAKELGGFNRVGWDTGDIKRADFDTVWPGYTYTNETKDAGDRVRNSYDVGDLNLNGECDTSETFTGRKLYTEEWTGVWTLINPADPTDKSGFTVLERAINSKLDPSLKISIDDNGIITMMNGEKDPWGVEYHGRYITNASTEAAALWNDTSMIGTPGDNLDMGAIILISNGPNNQCGTKVKIQNGAVTATISLRDSLSPDNNVQGQDDMLMAVFYSKNNGIGEVGLSTWGFSLNQEFYAGNNSGVTSVGNAHSVIAGSGQTYQLGSGGELTFTSDADYSLFVGVRVDGFDVAGSQYIATAGSTVIKLRNSYLETLEPGFHTIEILSSMGKAVTTFTIIG